MRRACDRCAAHKSHCDAEQPCGNCHRLGVDCTQNRPVLAKGRPRKGESRHTASNTTRGRQNTSDSQEDFSIFLDDLEDLSPSKVSLEIVGLLKDLPLSRKAAAQILELLFSASPHIGVLEVLGSNHQEVASVSHQPDQSFNSPGSEKSEEHNALNLISRELQSPTLIYTLLVVGLCLYYPTNTSANLPLLVDSLRMYALSAIPALHWKARELRCEDALSLCLLSYIGCLDPMTMEMAERWAVMASVIHRQACHANLEDTNERKLLTQRVSWLVQINDRIQALLFYRHAFDKHPLGPKLQELSVTPSHTTDTVLPSLNRTTGDGQKIRSCHLGDDYFSLFLPLLEPLDIALNRPRPSTREFHQAVDQLEIYFLDFPLSLLEFNKVKFLYQVESMIWFHGIYLLLYGNWDLYLLIADESWIDRPSFLSAVEHALLLGETLDTILHLDPTIRSISPGSTYFILNSSLIHAKILFHFYTTTAIVEKYKEQAYDSPHLDTDDTGMSDTPYSGLSRRVAPEMLCKSARLHLAVLTGLIKKHTATASASTFSTSTAPSQLPNLVFCVRDLLQSSIESSTLNSKEQLASSHDSTTYLGETVLDNSSFELRCKILLESLSRYRWLTPHGLGVVELEKTIAEALVQPSTPPLFSGLRGGLFPSITYNNNDNTKEKYFGLEAQISGFCNPGKRLCQEGFFNISLRFM